MRLSALGAAVALGTLFAFIPLALADVSLSAPLQSQRPDIAHTGTPYSWTLAQDTFVFTVPSGSQAPPSPPSLTYSATGLPSWLTFDASTRTFTGNVPDGGAGSKTSVSVSASLADGQLDAGGNTSASDAFSLLVLSAPAPTLSIPIAQQLTGAASSLGQANLLPNNVLHIPLGWSFSVGLQGDTFTLANGNKVYWSANLAGGFPLPSWMTWKADEFNVYGVAPVDIPAGGATYDVVFTASNRPGYGGTSDTLHIKVSQNTLTVDGSLDAAPGSVGVPFRTQINESTLRLDGRPSPASNNVTIAADLSHLAWLTFYNQNNTLMGTPPFELYGQANSTTAVQVPLTFSDSFGNKLPANQTINIAPYPFTAMELPNVFVQPGKVLSVSLSQYVRSIGADSNTTANGRVGAVISMATQTPNITTAFDPPSASSWLNFQSNTLELSGTVPSDFTDRVHVRLNANGTGAASGAASFFLAQRGDNPVGNPTTKSTGNGRGKGDSSLSRGARIALGVCLGLGALAALILFCCCKRRRRGQDDDARTAAVLSAQRNQPSDPLEGDEHTLTDQTTRSKLMGGMKFGKTKTPNTPSTIAVTPVPEERGTPKVGLGIAGGHATDSHSVVLVESPNGRRRDATHEADVPVQTGILANLFGGGRAKPPSTNPANRHSTGLGLSIDAREAGAVGGVPEMASIDSGRIRHQRSRQSVISQRSSWESDLFYEDAGMHRAGGAVERFENEAPRRRGLGESVRHRAKHDNTSPAFFAQDAFVPAGENQGPSTGMHDQLAAPMLDHASSSSFDSAYDDEGNDYVSSNMHRELRPDSHAADNDAQIMEARLMQVQRHSPMLHQGQNNPMQRASHHSHDALVREIGTSQGHDDVDEHVFDDAEGDASAPVQWGGNRFAGTGALGDNRNSALSAASDYGTSRQGHGRLLLSPAKHANSVNSPNPSFMDGASITGIEPSESVRPVLPRPRTPPRRAGQQKSEQSHYYYADTSPRREADVQTPPRPSTASSSASRHMMCPLIPATVGNLLSFHMYPNRPPPMAGAPGSPGKRSGRNVRYELVIDDPRPHLTRYRGQWPDMLSDWLTFDQSTFEVVGVVPRGAGLDLLGDCEIALVATSNIGRLSSSPHHQERSRASYSSHEGSRIAQNPFDDDAEIVARARLVFHAGHGKAF